MTILPPVPLMLPERVPAAAVIVRALAPNAVAPAPDKLTTLGRLNTYNRLNKKSTPVNKTFFLTNCKQESRPVKTT